MNEADAGTFEISPNHPHRVVGFNPDGIGFDEAIGYDDDGNRELRGDWIYRYDGPGRLVEVAKSTPQGESLRESNVYDEGTARVIRYDPGHTVRHYTASGLVELNHDGSVAEMYRYFSFAGRTIAYDVSLGTSYFPGAPDALLSTTNSGRRSLLGSDDPVAWSPLDRKYEILRSRKSARDGAVALCALTAAAVLIFLCLSNPGRGGVALATATVFLLTVAPLPSAVVLRAGGVFGVPDAHADDPVSWLYYLHGDHLGSVQVQTSGQQDATMGDAVENSRYRAYGQVRCQETDCSDTVAYDSSVSSTPRGFTGHQSTDPSGLIYMGARHYDPDLGSFLTFDPARQFASPYSYTGDYLTGATDPTGALTDFGIGVFFVALAAVSAFIPTLVKTGDLGAALTSAVIGAAVAALTTAAGQVLYSGADIALRVAAGAILFGSAAYGTTQSFLNGDVGVGIAGVAMLALGAYGLYRSEFGAGGAYGERDGLAGASDKDRLAHGLGKKGDVWPKNDPAPKSDGGNPHLVDLGDGKSLSVSGGLRNDRVMMAYNVEWAVGPDSSITGGIFAGMDTQEMGTLQVDLLATELFKRGAGGPAETILHGDIPHIRIDPRFTAIGDNIHRVIAHEFGHAFGDGGSWTTSETIAQSWSRQRRLDPVVQRFW